jgi:hypothetical protein
MTPLMTNLFADGRYHERVDLAGRKAFRERQLRSARDAELAGRAVLLRLTLPGMGVRRPHWWVALESGQTACDECDERSQDLAAS